MIQGIVHFENLSYSDLERTVWYDTRYIFRSLFLSYKAIPLPFPWGVKTKIHKDSMKLKTKNIAN